jgi:anti-sigma B factor antagonist
MSAQVTTRQANGITVLEVSGRIYLGEGGVVVRNAIQKALNFGARKLIVDMGDVNYMDSSGIGELTCAYTSAKRVGCDLKLVRLTPKIDNLMQLTKLDTIFEIYQDEQEAVASFCEDWMAVA